MTARALWPAAGLLLLALSGCDDAAPPAQAIQIYPSIQACEADHPVDECARAFAGAQAAHADTAPHYNQIASCEDVYGPGQCVPRGGGGGDGWFVPAMVGFMIGHALSGPAVVYQPVYVNRSGFAYTGMSPLGAYRSNCGLTGDCPGGFHSGSFIYGSSGGGSSSVWSSGHYATAPVPASVASRGGFGSGASLRKPLSSGGGGSFGVTPSATTSTGVTRGGFGSSASSFGSHGG